MQLSGAKTSWTWSYLSNKLRVVGRPFSSIPGDEEVIGIDLGTTNSRVAVMEGKNVEGSRTTPSVVAFKEKGEIIVGTQAKRQVLTNLRGTVFRTKRFIGRTFEELGTREEMKRVPYNIVKAQNGYACVEANGRRYSPSKIGAFILTKMKETAEAYLGKTVTKAVISVPCDSNVEERRATVAAALIAGLDVPNIIDDSIAAASSYGLNNKDGLIAVVDLGGGRFDASILRIENYCRILEISKTGDASLGGTDFDEAVLDMLISGFKTTDGIYLTSDRVSLQRLREAAETAKIELSSKTETDVHLPFITADEYGVKHLNITLTRSAFEAKVNFLIERIKSLCRKCIEDTGITTKELDDVLLVGGMSHVPIIQQLVTDIFGKTPFKGVNPDEAVVIGAAFEGLYASCPLEQQFLYDYNDSLQMRAYLNSLPSPQIRAYLK